MYALRNTQQQARTVMAAEDANRHLGVLKVNGVLRMNNRKKNNTSKCVSALSFVSISEKDRAMPPSKSE